MSSDNIWQILMVELKLLSMDFWCIMWMKLQPFVFMNSEDFGSEKGSTGEAAFCFTRNW